MGGVDWKGTRRLHAGDLSGNFVALYVLRVTCPPCLYGKNHNLKQVLITFFLLDLGCEAHLLRALITLLFEAGNCERFLPLMVVGLWLVLDAFMSSWQFV